MTKKRKSLSSKTKRAADDAGPKKEIITVADDTEAKPAEVSTGATKTEAPVTGKPVERGKAVEGPTFSEYLVTVNNQTGLATKIEKLNAETGERKELSSNEYAAAFAYATGTAFATPLSAYTAMASAPDAEELVRAYYQGISDYLKNLS
jgi:hypothetical protein